jgi:hypothetical protein
MTMGLRLHARGCLGRPRPAKRGPAADLTTPVALGGGGFLLGGPGINSAPSRQRAARHSGLRFDHRDISPSRRPRLPSRRRRHGDHAGRWQRDTVERASSLSKGRRRHRPRSTIPRRAASLGAFWCWAACSRRRRPDIFDPSADVWHSGPNLQSAWGASTVTLLQNGRVLVFRGEDASGVPVSTIKAYE